jgi:hypothetical protein
MNWRYADVRETVLPVWCVSLLAFDLIHGSRQCVLYSLSTLSKQRNCVFPVLQQALTRLTSPSSRYWLDRIRDMLSMPRVVVGYRDFEEVVVVSRIIENPVGRMDFKIRREFRGS